MARESVVAVDFLGLGMSVRERDNEELKADKERGKLVKPVASHPAALNQSPDGMGISDDGEHEVSLAKHVLRPEKNTHVPGSLTFRISPERSWEFTSGKGEEERRLSDDKPSEDFTESDNKQMTGEESRRYFQKMKGKEIHRPALNNNSGNNRAQVMQQQMNRRGLIEGRQQEENPANRSGGSPIKNGLLEASAHLGLLGPAGQHSSAGNCNSSSSGRNGNGFQAPRYNLVPHQVSSSEDAHGGARPSERPVPGLESNLSLAIPSSRELPPTQSSGFGSPLPPFLRMLRPPDHLQRVTSGQAGGSQVGSLSRAPGQGHLPGRPPTAQLTIFYAGMVNVYDDVPADKAQAIMLLAGSGSSWSSSCMNPPPSVTARTPLSTGGMASSTSALGSATTTSAPAASQGGSTAPLAPAISVPAALKQVPGRPILHAELPQARKASLARFLEKRKDRVRGKSPYAPQIFQGKRVVGDGSSTPPREKSPGPGNATLLARSPSPANAVAHKRSPSPASRPGPSQVSGIEPCSPSRRPATPQQTPQPSTPEDQVATSNSRRPNKEERMDWTGQQQTHPASQEQKPEQMEEVTGSPPERH